MGGWAGRESTSYKVDAASEGKRQRRQVETRVSRTQRPPPPARCSQGTEGPQTSHRGKSLFTLLCLTTPGDRPTGGALVLCWRAVHPHCFVLCWRAQRCAVLKKSLFKEAKKELVRTKTFKTESWWAQVKASFGKEKNWSWEKCGQWIPLRIHHLVRNGSG